MSVLPDYLFSSTAPAGVRPSSSGPSERLREAGLDQASSFAQVYAREREARPAEPREKARDEARGPAGEHGQADARTTRSSRQTQRADDAREVERPAAAAVAEDEASDDEKMTSADETDEVVSAETADTTASPVTAEASPTPPPDAFDWSLLGWMGAPPIAGETTGVTGDGPLAGPGTSTAVVPAAVVPPGTPSPMQVRGEGAVQAGDGLPETPLAALEAGTGETPEDIAGLAEALLDGASLAAGETGKAPQQASAAEAFAGRLQELAPLARQPAANARAGLALTPGQPLAVQSGSLGEGVVDRVMWMSSQNLKSAEIQLDPAELGRMEVRIDMLKDQTQVTFVSPHAAVRDALEGQMQRLRDLFTQQGMNLLDVNVSDQSLSRGWQGPADDQSSRRGLAAATGGEGEGEAASTGVLEIDSAGRSAAGRGLVDYYA